MPDVRTHLFGGTDRQVTTVIGVREGTRSGDSDRPLTTYVVRWEDVAEAIPGILERVEEWEQHVRDQTPPALDGLEATLAAVRQSHPQIDRGRAVTLSAETAQALAATRNARKVREGLVVSDKMDKTVVVEVEDRVKHALYGKVIRRTTKVKAHDEAEAAGIGDLVSIVETRPLSATKRWRVVEVLERAK